jgi:hypothetical protein
MACPITFLLLRPLLNMLRLGPMLDEKDVEMRDLDAVLQGGVPAALSALPPARSEGPRRSGAPSIHGAGRPGGAFFSTCHGAGRTMCRHAAGRQVTGDELRHQLEAMGALCGPAPLEARRRRHWRPTGTLTRWWRRANVQGSPGGSPACGPSGS